MNRLFERFITRWLQQMLAGSEYRVLAQRRDRTILWNAELSRPYASVIPDLVVERRNQPGAYLPVDAKYKLYDQRSMASGDIYQTFLYAYAYGEQHQVLPTAFVLYPASTINGGPSLLHVRRSGGITSAQLRAIPVHIPTALAEAKLGPTGPVATGLAALVKQAFSTSTAIRLNVAT